MNAKNSKSLEDMSIKYAIALVLDDYRIEFNKVEDDRIAALKTPQNVAEWLCRAISDYLSMKTKGLYKDGPQNEIEAGLWPLLKRQRLLLGESDKIEQ